MREEGDYGDPSEGEDPRRNNLRRSTRQPRPRNIFTYDQPGDPITRQIPTVEWTVDAINTYFPLLNCNHQHVYHSQYGYYPTQWYHQSDAQPCQWSDLYHSY